MGVIKSGWLYHYSSGKFSKSWKLRFVILYDDDHISIYKRPKDGADLQPLHRINIRKQCKQILSGHLCYTWKSMQLPDGVLDIDALFTVKVQVSRNVEDFTFAASRVSECKNWEDVLQRAQGKATNADVFEEELLHRNCQDY